MQLIIVSNDGPTMSEMSGFFFLTELVTNLHKKLWNFELPVGPTPFNLPRTQSSEQKVAIP